MSKMSDKNANGVEILPLLNFSVFLIILVLFVVPFFVIINEID